MASASGNKVLRRRSAGVRKRSAKDDVWTALVDAAAQAAAEAGMVSPAGSSASPTQSVTSATPPPGQGSAAAGAFAGSRSAASPFNRAGLSNIAASANQQQQQSEQQQLAEVTRDKFIETIQRHNYEINFVLRPNHDAGTRISLFEAKLQA
jgi:hypothetical protein